MRVALGVLFLLLLFVAAALVQERWLKDVEKTLPGLQVRAEQPRSAEEPAEDEPLPAEDGWARLVVGRPSGADPVVLPPAERRMIESAPTHTPNPAPVEPESAPPSRPADYEITLAENETLSEVCVRFYGSGAPKLYDRLARYNGLANANAIRAGQKLFVPPTQELLFAE